MKRTIFAAALVFAAVAATAQPGRIDHTPILCLRGGEMPVLQVEVEDKGILRAYFRRTNSTDWCSVEGTNMGKLSSVTLPKFDFNDEIEYFFVIINGKKIIAKSPQIYRVKATDSCDTPWARHTIMVIMDCTETGPGSIPSSLGAGYAVKSSKLPEGSPSTPTNAAAQ
jgi:hypothetical protein